MKRREFLASLAAIVAAGKAAPGILAKLRVPAPAPPLGLLDAISTSSLHGLSRSTYPLSYVTITDLPSVNRFYWSTGVARQPRRPAIRRSSGFSAWERRVLG